MNQGPKNVKIIVDADLCFDAQVKNVVHAVMLFLVI